MKSSTLSESRRGFFRLLGLLLFLRFLPADFFGAKTVFPSSNESFRTSQTSSCSSACLKVSLRISLVSLMSLISVSRDFCLPLSSSICCHDWPISSSRPRESCASMRLMSSVLLHIKVTLWSSQYIVSELVLFKRTC